MLNQNVINLVKTFTRMGQYSIIFLVRCSGEMITTCHRVCAIEMARLLLRACHGDWTQGQNVAFAGSLRDFVENKKDHGDFLPSSEVLAIVQFRWDMGRLNIVNHTELPKPCESLCMWWQEQTWKPDIAKRLSDYDKLYCQTWDALIDADFFITDKGAGTPFQPLCGLYYCRCHQGRQVARRYDGSDAPCREPFQRI